MTSMAISLLCPTNSIVRILLPDNGGFLTVAWNNDKDTIDSKVPLARDLMKKVLAKFSRKVLGLTTLETDFEKRAALDFRPRRATDTHNDDYRNTLLSLYRFVVMKGSKKTIFKPTQPLITLFTEGADDTKASSKQKMARVTLGLWRSNWQEDTFAIRPRRRTIATPRQLVLARRVVLGIEQDSTETRAASDDDKNDSGEEDVPDDGWQAWDGVRVVSHRSSVDDGWTDSEIQQKKKNQPSLSNQNNGSTTATTATTATTKRSGIRRRQTVDSGRHLTNPSIKLSKELAQMIRETGVAKKDKRCTMLNVDIDALTDTLPTTSTTETTSTESSDQLCTQTDATDGDEWGFNSPSPWSRKTTGGSRSSFSMLEEPPTTKPTTTSTTTAATTTTLTTTTTTPTTPALATATTRTSASMSDISVDTTTSETKSPTSNHSKSLRPKGSRRRNHRRRMSALTESTQYLLDDSIGTVLSMNNIITPKSSTPVNLSNLSETTLNTTANNTSTATKTKTTATPRTTGMTPGSLSKLLHQPAPEMHEQHEDAARARINRIKQQIHDAEEFVRYLPSVSFDVVKVNGLGRRQRRVLRVTSSRVLNCKVVKDEINGSKHNDHHEDYDPEDEEEEDNDWR